MTSSVSQTPGLRFINAGEAKPEIVLIYNPTTGDYDLATSSDGLQNVANFVWNTGTLSWDKMTPASGGGGGGAVTIANGDDVAEGNTGDAVWSGSGAGTVISLLKKIASAGGSAVSIADGADVAEGATTDAAVITNAAGTVSGKLRGLVKWAFERMPAALGQTTMANSLPVVIASDQSGVPVTGPLTNAQLRAAPVDVSGSTVGVVGTVTISDGSGPVTVDGTVAVSNFPAVQPVNDNGGSLTVDLISTTITGSVAVTGPLTDAQLRATPVPVSGTVTITDGSGPVTVDGTVAISGTVPISAAALPLPAGAATEATLAAINTKTPAQGLATAANSSPVVLASDGLGSGVGNPLFISGSISATSAATASSLAPVFSEAQVAPLSQTLFGALRVETAGDEISKYYRRLEEVENLQLALSNVIGRSLGERDSSGLCDTYELR